MAITSTNLDYLLPFLRQRLGDTTIGEYRYTDEWLMTALVAAVWALQPRWSRKYLTDENNDAVRNTTEWVYADSEPPVIQPQDVEPLILQAAIVVLEGSLESYSWHLGSWRDAEIYYSNVESGRIKDKNIKRLIEALDAFMPPRNKRLKYSLKGSLPGYRGNLHESGVDY